MTGKALRALVVEDDAAWQTILAEVLGDLGLAVDVAATLDDAVQQMRAAPHRLALIDLALDSRNHRNQDGLAVLNAVREYDPGCISILLTGYATVEIAVRALTDYGTFTCLRKENFTRASFREVLHKALSESPVRSQAVAARPLIPLKGDAGADTMDVPPIIGTAIVVDDDAGWRSIIDELLTEARYTTRLCSGFGEAIGCLGRERYDLAVIDLNLRPRHATEYDGLRLLMGTRSAGTPTIVVSGVASSAEIEHIYADYGVLYCMEKQTFDRQAFLSAVGEACSARMVASDLAQLTERERQVLVLLAGGMTNQEIAESLIISTNTVKRHLKAIFAKLGIHTRSAAATRAFKAGLSAGWLNPENHSTPRP